MITFVSGEYPPDVGGLGDYTLRLREALTNRGCLSRVVSRRQVRRWNARSTLWLLRHAPGTGIVHIQYQAAAYDLLGDICLVPGLLRGLRPRVRTVATFHDLRVPYLFPKAGALRPVAIRLLARTSHAAIAADQRDIAALRQVTRATFQVAIGPNVVRNPPDGYERAAFRRSLGLEPDDLALVYFGLLNASKGLDLLLSAFECIRTWRPGARLLMLGGPAGASDPTDRTTGGSLRARLGRLGAAAIQTGWLPPRELSGYLLAGDVALLPYVDGASARRGSLLACAEHGLPIVSTQPAGLEVAGHVQAVESRAAALAEAVLSAAADPAPLAERSRALADRMSWPRIATDHLTIYEQLLYSRP
ncbi:MAG: glycosyl transferase family 1 [Chloroflexi bacterium]|nr:glycosyl transferase family 1 [Chloroflexota bacterium]